MDLKLKCVIEKTIQADKEITAEEIKQLYPKLFGVEFNSNCSYEKSEPSEQDILAYTE